MLLGIDIGTTHIKVCAYDNEGNLLSSARRHTPVRRLPEGGAEYHATRIEHAAFEAAREVIEQTEPPEAIGISSMGESGFLIGDDGEPLGPAIAWFDTRTAPQASYWGERIPPEELFFRTGLRAAPIYSACKLEWLREHSPNSWSQARGWLGMAEYLTFRMTGSVSTDPSLASRTMLFRIDQGEWDEELCRLADIPIQWLPPVFPAGSGPGRLTETVAESISAHAGIPVVVCGHDHLCGAVGSGATASGEIVDSIGTAEACLLSLQKPPLNESGYELGLPVGCHVLSERYYIAATLSASGGMVDWLQHLLGGDDSDLVQRSRNAELLAPAEGGVCLPLPESDLASDSADARVAFFALGQESRSEHLLRAALEGLTMEVRVALEKAVHAAEVDLTSITLIGGGAGSRLWRQLKADVMAMPVRAVSDPECVARGAALLAGVGAGVFANADSIPAPSSCLAVHYPSDDRLRYERIYSKIYLPLREQLRPMHSVWRETRRQA